MSCQAIRYAFYHRYGIYLTIFNLSETVKLTTRLGSKDKEIEMLLWKIRNPNDIFELQMNVVV